MVRRAVTRRATDPVVMRPATAPPLVLLACVDEWLSRTLESVFEQRGYAVTRVRTGARTIRLARRASPDVVMLEEGNGDLDALRVCTALSDDPLFDHTVPIVITAAAPVSVDTRHAAYAAGAWEYCSHPVDLEALMLKLATFRRARSEALANRAERLTDRETGFFTAAGLQRIAEQVGGRAKRMHEPLACVTLSLRLGQRPGLADGPPTEDADDDNLAMVAELCRAAGRKSDVIAMVSGSRLAILAPGTDADGARLMVSRIRRTLERGTEREVRGGEFELRAGYSAVADLSASGVEPLELFRQAERALDHLQVSDASEALMSYDELSRTSSASRSAGGER